MIEKIKALHVLGYGYTQISKALNANGDNASLQLNKQKINLNGKTPIFYAQTIKRILIEHGLVDPAPEEKRKHIAERIMTHHAPMLASVSNNSPDRLIP